MATPKHTVAWMAVLLALLALACALALDPLRAAFLRAAPINGAIVALFAFGGLVGLWHAAALGRAFTWVDRVRRGFAVKEPPKAVAALARAIAGREREGFTVSALSMAGLMEGVRLRLRQALVLPHAMVLLLFALGLGGALWGLLHERPDAALSPLFFGLAAGVALGVMNLLARQAQVAVERELEDFLASRTELPSTVLGGENALPGYLEGMLKQSAESMLELQRLMVRTEEERRATQGALSQLTERLAELSDHLRAEHKVLVTLSRSHNQLQPAIADLAAEVAGAAAASEEMRAHLRNLDLAVGRLVEEVSAARSQTHSAVRQELKMLSQALAPALLRKAS